MNQISKFLLIIFLISSIKIVAQPQKNYVKHTVIAGENVTQIAKKYRVTPYDIYTLNPEAKNGIKENDILIINTIESKGEEKETRKERKIREKLEEEKEINSYIVIAKDTKYSLSKKFDITIEELEKWNPFIVRDGLQEGQVLIVKNPVFEEKKEEKKGNVEVKRYTIQPKDTKFSVAKRFGLTIDELEALNPEIKESFPEGLEIIVSNLKENRNNSEYQQYTILNKETLYGVSKKFNVSQMEILKLNPELKEGFKEGLVINIPNNTLEVNVDKIDKLKLVPAKNTREEKTLVMFLPFNIPLIESDTTKTKGEYLKNDRFLNMTLDFYAGALIAIDSVKKLGYPVKVKIYDSESIKSTNSIPSIIAKNDFSNVDAIIGPFMDNQVEQASKILEKYNIPIVSPLSNRNGKPFQNVYYAMPSEILQREMLFNYFKKNNGNVLAIFSSKKVSNKETLLAQFPDLKVVPLGEKGGVTAESISTLLDPTRKNFVILDTENRGMVLNATSILKKLLPKFDIQLVVFELYEALDFEDIPIKTLTDLKMLFPSVTKSTDNGYYKSFQEKFKKVNNINPNQFATRGFDVTLDTVLRMYQEGGFVNSTVELSSEQLESKFSYRKIEEGNYNTGLYILQYTDDLTIEEAK